MMRLTDAMGKDFRKLLEFWKKVYLRKNREEVSDERKDIKNGIRCHSLLDE